MLVAVSRGAQVVAVDVSAEALRLAGSIGASTLIDARADDVDAAIRGATLGGAHVVGRGPGRAGLLRQGLACLRPGGRHVQVGLLAGADADPRVTSAGSSASNSSCSAATACPPTNTPPCSTRSPWACSTRARWSDGRSHWMPRPQRSRR